MAKKSHKNKQAAKQKSILLLAVAILLIVAVGIGLYIILNQKPPQSDQQKPLTREEQLQLIRTDADRQAQTKNAAEGAKIYDKAIADTADQQEKSELMASKATLFLNEGKYDQALAYALQADTLHSTKTVAALVAQLYEQQGNKPKAVEYYKKAITLVDPKKSAMANSDKAYYQSKVTELGGAQ